MIATVVTAALTTLLLHGAHWLWKRRNQVRFRKRVEPILKTSPMYTEEKLPEPKKVEPQKYVVCREFRHNNTLYCAGREVEHVPGLDPALKIGWLRKREDPEPTYQVPRGWNAGIHHNPDPVKYVVEGQLETLHPKLIYRLVFQPLYSHLYTVLVKGAPPEAGDWFDDLRVPRAILKKDNDLTKVLTLQNRRAGNDTFREEDAPNLLNWLANPPTDKDEQSAQLLALSAMWEGAPNTEEVVAQILSSNLNQIAEKLVLEVINWKRQVTTDVEQVFKFRGYPADINIDSAIDQELARRSSIPPPEDNVPLSFESMIDVVKFMNRHVPSPDQDIVANSDPPPKPDSSEPEGGSNEGSPPHE